MVVERQLNAVGQSRIDLGRAAFVDKVWEWKEKSGGLIARQLRRLARRSIGGATSSPWIQRCRGR